MEVDRKGLRRRGGVRGYRLPPRRDTETQRKEPWAEIDLSRLKTVEWKVKERQK